MERSIHASGRHARSALECGGSATAFAEAGTDFGGEGPAAATAGVETRWPPSMPKSGGKPPHSKALRAKTRNLRKIPPRHKKKLNS